MVDDTSLFYNIPVQGLKYTYCPMAAQELNRECTGLTFLQTGGQV
jgi:hypothetical protein